MLRENTQKIGNQDAILSLRNPPFPLQFSLSWCPIPALKWARHSREMNAKSRVWEVRCPKWSMTEQTINWGTQLIGQLTFIQSYQRLNKTDWINKFIQSLTTRQELCFTQQSLFCFRNIYCTHTIQGTSDMTLRFGFHSNVCIPKM